MNMKYFGTDLTSPGHFFWILEDDSLRNNREFTWDGIPFNPEELTGKYMGVHLPKGEIVFLQKENHTVIAISGSCADNRIGCKSVFWVEETLSFEKMKERILDIPIAVRMIDKMPFDVKWEN